jgi:hypothetical protein
MSLFFQGCPSFFKPLSCQGELILGGTKMIGLRTSRRIATTAGTCVFLLNVAMRVRPEAIGILLAFFAYWALLIGILVSFGIGVAEWSIDNRFWMAPAVICATFAAATHWLSMPAGRLISDCEFRLHLNEFKNTVEALGEPSSQFSEGCRSRFVSSSQRKLPYRIVSLTKIECDGRITVAFLVGGDPPRLHEGYVFRGYDDHDPAVNKALRIESQWLYTRHIVGDWYRFADQADF